MGVLQVQTIDAEREEADIFRALWPAHAELNKYTRLMTHAAWLKVSFFCTS